MGTDGHPEDSPGRRAAAVEGVPVPPFPPQCGSLTLWLSEERRLKSVAEFVERAFRLMRPTIDAAEFRRPKEARAVYVV